MLSLGKHGDEEVLCQHNGTKQNLTRGNYGDNKSIEGKVFSWFARLFFVLFTVAVGVYVYHLSQEIKALSFQLEEDRNTIRKVLSECRLKKTPGTGEMKANGNEEFYGGSPIQMQERIEAVLNSTVQNDRSENRSRPEIDAKVRSKRSASRRRKKHPSVGPCHLVGVGVTNAAGGIPEQLPRTMVESILWQKPDKQSSSYCFMATKSTEQGIESIKVTLSGFYYVYSQLTHYSTARSETGHRIVLDKPSVRTNEELAVSIAQPVRDHTSSGQYNIQYLMESSFTAGIFHFVHGDLITVYPFEGGTKFMMLGSRSFFGALYLGEF